MNNANTAKKPTEEQDLYYIVIRLRTIYLLLKQLKVIVENSKKNFPSLLPEYTKTQINTFQHEAEFVQNIINVFAEHVQVFYLKNKLPPTTKREHSSEEVSMEDVVKSNLKKIVRNQLTVPGLSNATIEMIQSQIIEMFTTNPQHNTRKLQNK